LELELLRMEDIFAALAPTDGTPLAEDSDLGRLAMRYQAKMHETRRHDPASREQAFGATLLEYVDTQQHSPDHHRQVAYWQAASRNALQERLERGVDTHRQVQQEMAATGVIHPGQALTTEVLRGLSTDAYLHFLRRHQAQFETDRTQMEARLPALQDATRHGIHQLVEAGSLPVDHAAVERRLGRLDIRVVDYLNTFGTLASTSLYTGTTTLSTALVQQPPEKQLHVVAHETLHGVQAPRYVWQNDELASDSEFTTREQELSGQQPIWYNGDIRTSDPRNLTESMVDRRALWIAGLPLSESGYGQEIQADGVLTDQEQRWLTYRCFAPNQLPYEPEELTALHAAYWRHRTETQRLRGIPVPPHRT
jgi:predicted metal-dependent hydrolase